MNRPWLISKPVSLTFVILMTITLALLFPAAGLADGGQIRVDGWRVGTGAITIYTTPSPLRVGTADVSATIQQAQAASDSKGDVADVRLWVSAHQAGGGKTTATNLGPFELTKKQATKIGFIAAEFHLPHRGAWTFTVKAQVGNATARHDFPVDVAPEGFFSAHSWLIWVVGFGIGGLLIWWAFFARDAAGDDEERDEVLSPE